VKLLPVGAEAALYVRLMDIPSISLLHGGWASGSLQVVFWSLNAGLLGYGVLNDFVRTRRCRQSNYFVNVWDAGCRSIVVCVIVLQVCRVRRRAAVLVCAQFITIIS
jgi:hypothetical protein